jgi:hypothetical protein
MHIVEKMRQASKTIPIAWKTARCRIFEIAARGSRYGLDNRPEDAPAFPFS